MIFMLISFFKQLQKDFKRMSDEMDKICSDNRDTTDKLNKLKENSKIRKNIEEFKKREFNNKYQ